MFKKISLWLFTYLFFFLGNDLLAVPAVPWAVEKIQPDGSKISVYIRGDEKVHWFESVDGYTLMYDAQKYLVYAQTDSQGNMVPSNTKFKSGVKPAANIAKGLTYSKAQVNTMKQIWEMTDEATIQRSSVGDVNALCVLAAFANKAFVRTPEEFDALMNQVGYSTGGAKGSVRDYYLENSYGLVTLHVTVVGPVTVSHNTSYYGESSTYGDPSGRRYQVFAREVIDLIDPTVDFSQFANASGLVENFHIIFAGYGDEAIGNHMQIWSHEWDLGTTVTKDGVKLSNYSCSPELRGSSGQNLTYIGVIAHEMCHIFGSPDYYDISANGGGTDFIGSGNWDLMAGGSWNDNGRQPASINPYQKIQFGWITPQTLTPGSSVGNMPPSAKDPVIYKVEANSDGEHYLLDNKQAVGFDTSLPGHGLLIWHIANTVSDYGPNDNPPLQMYPVCASSSTAIPGNTVSSYGSINSAGCPFPGTSRKTEFTDTSTPQAFTWTGLKGIGKPITNITENADHTVAFNYIADAVSDPVTNLQGFTDKYQGTLTWEAPAVSQPVKKYEIRRDNVLLGETTDLTYTDVVNIPGTYNYAVTVVYNTGISSKPASIDLTYTIELLYLEPFVTVADKVYDATLNATILLVTFKDIDNTDIPVNGEDYAVSATFDDINAGPYITVNGTITLSSAGAAKYRLSRNDFTTAANIIPATLTICPDDATRPYGAPNPEFTITCTGFADSDSPADLGDLTVTTTATESSLPGIYPITAGGAQNTNYEITYKSGKLTIEKLDQSINSYDEIPSMDLGNTFSINAKASSGLSVAYDSSDPTIATVESNGKVSAVGEGTVTITLTQVGNVIYNAAKPVVLKFVVSNMTGMDHVAVRPITVYPSPAAKSSPVYVSADVDETLLSGATIDVYNTSGSLIKSVEVTGKLTKVDLPSVAGTYVFVLKGKAGVVIKNMKVVVK